MRPPCTTTLARTPRGEPRFSSRNAQLRREARGTLRSFSIGGTTRVSELRIEDSKWTNLAFARVGDVLRVEIAHPTNPMNVVDGEMHDDLARLFRELKRERTARAVLITGRGKFFSAGGDFNWFPTLQDPANLELTRRDGKQLVWDLLDVELPIVAAVNGAAVGLGASIALLCDVIFMADSAQIADPHVRVGVVAGDGGAAIWPLLLGPARAKQYLMTGDAVKAPEAERIGLVNRVVPAAELEAEAMKFAQRLAAGAPLAVQFTKQSVNKLVKDALNTAFDTSMALEMLTFRSEDHREALAAIREKRAPHFRGR
ncbi:MAG: enoyl-CoA hydratase/isomerase family protein [Deltaproteobacteria bacterium]|nr:enoyl-CoA hydratase/isomerase family protein [Deltaproteobacteria bacterium]